MTRDKHFRQITIRDPCHLESVESVCRRKNDGGIGPVIARCLSISPISRPRDRLYQGSTGDSRYQKHRLTVRCPFVLGSIVFPQLSLLFCEIEMDLQPDEAWYVLRLLTGHSGSVGFVMQETLWHSICATMFCILLIVRGVCSVCYGRRRRVCERTSSLHMPRHMSSHRPRHANTNYEICS